MNLGKVYNSDLGNISSSILLGKHCAKEQMSERKCTDLLVKHSENINEFSRKRGRPCNSNAARERSRVKTLRTAFRELQETLPSVPPDTKLSKLDVLVLATTYISHLMRTLEGEQESKIPFSSQGFMHPVKKWPMRTRLYAGILASTDRDSELRSSTSLNPGYRPQKEWDQ